jgi:CheY-like chemotaxis protein
MRRALAPSSGLRVLIVDDDLDLTDSLGLLVKSWGHEVRVAHEGAEALRLVADWQPGIVCVDLAMPRMDGLHLASQISALHQPTQMMLMALTGISSKAIRRRAKELHFTCYLLKPADPALLQQILDRVARTRPAPPALS